MDRASLLITWLKRLIFFAAFPFLFSCTQEYLILLKNLNRANFISPEQILEESGLKIQKEEIAHFVPKKENSSKTVPQTVPNQNGTNILKQLMVAPDQDFSVNLSADNGFVILKSVQGGIEYLKEKSNLQKGVYVFHTGSSDGSVQFQVADQTGNPLKNVRYSIKVLQAQAVSQSPSNVTVNNAVTNVAETLSPSPNLSQMVLSSIIGLSPTEAVRELKKMLDSSEISDNDKEFIRYKMLDILIDQRSFSAAEENIAKLRSEPKKMLYRARLLKMRGNRKEAVRNYIALLSSEDETKKTAILELENLVLDMGTVDKSLVESLNSETKKYKNDSDFYGNSMIRVAKIYPLIHDVYTAKEILESILNGDFSEEIKSSAREANDRLKKDFLEYR